MTALKSLNKSLSIMELFLNHGEEIALTDLARLSGFDKSTVKHIVSVLVARGYLAQSRKRGKYSLGTKFLDYSGTIKGRCRIRNEAMPHLIKLARLTNESVILTILDGKFAAHNEVIPSEHALRIAPDEGTVVPLYCTGVGKVFLAGMTRSEVDEYLSSTPLKPYTDNTIVHPDYLRAHIAIIAREGVAYENEEFSVGIRNVAAPIKDAEGKTVAAIGVLGPSVRLSRQRMLEIAPEIKISAAEISRELGYGTNGLKRK